MKQGIQMKCLCEHLNTFIAPTEINFKILKLFEICFHCWNTIWPKVRKEFEYLQSVDYFWLCCKFFLLKTTIYRTINKYVLVLQNSKVKQFLTLPSGTLRRCILLYWKYKCPFSISLNTVKFIYTVFIRSKFKDFYWESLFQLKYHYKVLCLIWLITTLTLINKFFDGDFCSLVYIWRIVLCSI